MDKFIVPNHFESSVVQFSLLQNDSLARRKKFKIVCYTLNFFGNYCVLPKSLGKCLTGRLLFKCGPLSVITYRTATKITRNTLKQQ